MSSPLSFVSVEAQGLWESDLAKSQSKEVYVEQISELRAVVGISRATKHLGRGERKVFKLNWIANSRAAALTMTADYFFYWIKPVIHWMTD